MTVSEYWHPIAASHEVTDRPLRVDLLTRQLVCYRTGNGDAVVLDDLCAHRGAALSLGWTRDDMLVCPYHGWRYDRTGQVCPIPALKPGAKIPSRARTHRFPVVEKAGLVWTALADPIAPVPEWPSGEDTDPDYHQLVIGPYDWRAAIGRSVENNFDFTHFPFVHRGLLGTEDQAEAPDYDVVTTEDGIYYEIEASAPDIRTGFARPGTAQTLRYQFWLRTPFTVFIRTTYPDGGHETLGMFHIPVAPRLTRIYNVVQRDFAKDDPAERDAFDRQRAERNAIVLEQDRPVIESQRPEQIPADVTAELHIKPDYSSMVLRRVMAEVGEFEEWPLTVGKP